MIHDKLTEQTLLSTIIFKREALLKAIDELNIDDFWNDDSIKLFQVIKHIYKSGKKVEILSIRDELLRLNTHPVKVDTMIADLSVINSGDITNLISILKDYSDRRKLKRLSEQINDCSDSKQQSLDDITCTIQNAIKDINKDSTKDIITIKDTSFEDVMKAGNYTQTGISDIDSKIGGLYDSDLIILAARTSVGKSALALQIAQNIAKVKTVLFFSIEMPVKQLVQRLLSYYARIDLFRLRQGYLNESDMEVLKECYGRILKDIPNLRISDNIYDLNGIITACRREAESSEIGLVVVDYIQLVKVHGISEKRLQVVEVSRELKLLAKELDCPVIAVAQLNRAVQMRVKQEPELSDLKESGSLEEDADVVMFIYSKDKYDEDAEVRIEKNRNGSIGKIYMKFEKSYMRFCGITREGKNE